MRFYRLLLCVTCLLAGTLSLPALVEDSRGFNWIKNGSFEDEENWAQPVQIAPGPEKLKSAFLENLKPEWKGYTQRILFQNNPPLSIEISGRIKTENVVQGIHDWQKARIAVVFYDQDGKRVGDWPAPVGQLDGTHDWQSFSVTYRLPNATRSAEISLVLDNCSGKAWFSDLRCLCYDFDLQPLLPGASAHPGARGDAAKLNDNWLINPGFEIPGSRDWSGGKISPEGYESLHSLCVSQDTPSWNSGSQDVSFKGQHPESVVLGAWMRTQNVVRGAEDYMTARISIEFRDDSGKIVGGWQQALGNVVGDSPWTHYEKNYPVPQGAVSAHIEAGLANCSGEAWFDDMSLKLLDEEGAALKTVVSDRQVSDTHDWWSYTPPTRPSGVALDLSFLNDKPAGTHGFIRVKDGHFEFQDGKRVRFWGTDIVGPNHFLERSQADALALRLSRLGVNLVRLHMPDAGWTDNNLFDPTADNTQQFKPSQLDKFDYLIAALKKQGIYVYPDWMVARLFRPGDQVQEASGLEEGAKGVIHFDPHVIALNKKYASELIGHENPYTGLALKDDPIYLGNDIVNESSIFSGFQEQKFPEVYWEELQSMYHAWGGHGKMTRFKFDGNEEKLLPIQNSENADTTLHFLYAMSVKNYLEMKDFQRHLSPHGLLTGSNMGLPVLGDLRADSQLDFMDAHAYWDHPQIWNIEGGWAQAAYAPMNNSSQLHDPFKGSLLFNLAHAAVEGKPMIVTEWNDCFPNEYRLEGPVLMAAYACLQDWDGMLQFAYAPELPGSKPMNNFDINSRPDNEALYQAGALIFRLGMLKASPQKIVEPLSDSSLFANGMQSPWLFEHPWLPYAVRVAKRFTGKREEAPSTIAGVEKLNHADQRWIESSSAEETLDYGKSRLKLNSPGVQGFAGNLGTGELLETSGMTLRVAPRNPWAAVLGLSLDGRPLVDSTHLIVVAVARAENSGQIYNATRTALKDPGGVPVLMQGVAAEASLRLNGRGYSVRTLDADGRPGLQLKASLDSGVFKFKISPSDKSCYYEITRNP